MSRLGKLFRRQQDDPGVHAFWKWFAANNKRYRHLELLSADAAHQKLDEIIDRLKLCNPRFKALIGRYDDSANEFAITADGEIALFVMVEDMIAAAPKIPGWKFTAHKPAVGFETISMEMFGRIFNKETVMFFPLLDDEYPDMVSIAFVHKDYDARDHEEFETATSIYIQNALGEMNVATLLDHYEVSGPPPDASELIPVQKLPDYLTWRQKEFVEKYDNNAIELPKDTFNTIEGEDEDGNVMMAIAVASYEEWPHKPAFPWLVAVQMEYAAAENGLPDEPLLQKLHDTEDAIISLLTKDLQTLYVASRTYSGFRTTYFYSKNFRDASRRLHEHLATYNGEVKISFFVERDKYWQNTKEFFDLPEDLETDDPEEEEEE